MLLHFAVTSRATVGKPSTASAETPQLYYTDNYKRAKPAPSSVTQSHKHNYDFEYIEMLTLKGLLLCALLVASAMAFPRISEMSGLQTMETDDSDVSKEESFAQVYAERQEVKGLCYGRDLARVIHPTVYIAA